MNKTENLNLNDVLNMFIINTYTHKKCKPDFYNQVIRIIVHSNEDFQNAFFSCNPQQQYQIIYIMYRMIENIDKMSDSLRDEIVSFMYDVIKDLHSSENYDEPFNVLAQITRRLFN